MPTSILSKPTKMHPKYLSLILTFSAYAAFHASRKPSSIVKSTLATWSPFHGPKGTHRLGELDLAFLSSYSVGMFLSGHVADTIDLRAFLAIGMFLSGHVADTFDFCAFFTIGMFGSGFFTILFGLGFFFGIHQLGFYLIVQVLCGFFQSIGWPCVVAVVGNWFGKSKRGLIMGVWNSHTSVGNIIGSLVASSALSLGWGWSFVFPGIFIILIGIVVYFFLFVGPQEAGVEERESGSEVEMNVEGVPLVGSEKIGIAGPEGSDSMVAIGFLEAWRLPNVAPFAFSLFFSKLVAYTFLYWLPFYIRHTAVAGVNMSHKTAGILSTIFDIGGVFGGILAGLISDILKARGTTSVIFLLLSIPALILYRVYGDLSMFTNISLMFVSGLLVNGPYALITTAVAADLGTQDLIKGNSRALATVTAIIDGTGSVGAAIGPLLAGYFSTRGWNSVFTMLIVSISMAALLLFRVVRTEIKGNLSGRK